YFPVGKLPAGVLDELLARAPIEDPSVVVCPGVGLDCAVVEVGDRLLVAKSDPITFVADDLGRYLVQINANDIATTGATPRWLLLTLLLPEAQADRALVESIMDQVGAGCREMGVTLIGGHTEITHGLDRPIAVGALLGEVTRERLVTPRGASPGDRVLLTKGVPIEGTAIIADAFAGRLRGVLNDSELERARAFSRDPGISVWRDARVAMAAGRVTAMHDPTEGGLATALWELAEASGRGLRIDPSAIPIPALSARACEALGVDPLGLIASGALLLTVAAEDAAAVVAALKTAGVACADIGEVREGPAVVEQRTDAGVQPMPMPERDEIARLFEAG
ncbi:MAG TPA: AIR synthase family protein, partial [Gammaproteobacteria bacterium]|nr:AIR synthase family protein [Gammaproteobacteria bacterium]